MKCVICGKEIKDKFGHNPYPIAMEGRCCSDCNYSLVIPARLKIMKRGEINERRVQNSKNSV